MCLMSRFLASRIQSNVANFFFSKAIQILFESKFSCDQHSSCSTRADPCAKNLDIDVDAASETENDTDRGQIFVAIETENTQMVFDC